MAISSNVFSRNVRYSYISAIIGLLDCDAKIDNCKSFYGDVKNIEYSYLTWNDFSVIVRNKKLKIEIMISFNILFSFRSLKITISNVNTSVKIITFWLIMYRRFV